MKKRCLAIILVITLLLTFVSCEKQPENLTDVNIKKVLKQDLGSAVPQILFVHDEKIAFWGTFGLFIVNGTDGSVYRAVNLENINYNHMGGELLTRFQFSEDYNKIYFFNEDSSENNVDDFYQYYNIEEDVLRQVPNGTGVEILPKQPIFSMEIAGGEREEGYYSGPVFYDDDTTVYLYAKDWTVKKLELAFYNIDSGETTMVPLFK